MADNIGTLVTAPIRPASDLDVFPAFWANDGYGGWHSALTLVERDAIPPERLCLGMRCWVEAEKKVYHWDLPTATWIELAEGVAALVTKFTYGENFAVNECFQLKAGVILKVTSKDTDAPWVDGVTLESGIAGSLLPVASIVNKTYTAALAFPPSPGRVLFLGQDGKLTPNVPARSAGDIWLVRVARRNSDQQFTLMADNPIRLS